METAREEIHKTVRLLLSASLIPHTYLSRLKQKFNPRSKPRTVLQIYRKPFDLVLKHLKKELEDEINANSLLTRTNKYKYQLVFTKYGRGHSETLIRKMA